MTKNTKSKSSEESKPPDKYTILIVFFIAVLGIQIVYGFLIYTYITNWTERSNFGEMFGALNTIFSGWAFAGVIYTIALQRRELELQRRELEMTRKELERSAEAQEKSERALTQQASSLNEQAKALKLAAKLNAINTLINLYNERYSHSDPKEKQDLAAKKNSFYKELETMLIDDSIEQRHD